MFGFLLSQESALFICN